MDLRRLKTLVSETFKDWSEDKASRLAASLAYYTIFSLPALLLIALAIAGRFFESDVIKERILAQAQSAMGNSGAEVIGDVLENASTAGAGTLALLVGVIVLLLGASGVFGQLQGALNTIWEVEPKPGRGLLGTIKDRLFSFTLVLGVGFLLLVSLVLDAVLSFAGDFLVALLPSVEVAQVLNSIVSAGLTFGLIAAIFKVIPDVTVRWRQVWVGALITTILFVTTRLFIGLYLGNNATASAYGAAGSLVLLLLWVYVSAQILFLGAEFTQVYARLSGAPIRPDDNAVALSERTRIQQGMPKKETTARKQQQQEAAILPAPGEGGRALASGAHGSPPDLVQPMGTRAGLRRRLVLAVSAVVALALAVRDVLPGRASRAAERPGLRTGAAPRRSQPAAGGGDT